MFLLLLEVLGVPYMRFNGVSCWSVPYISLFSLCLWVWECVVWFLASYTAICIAVEVRRRAEYFWGCFRCLLRKLLLWVLWEAPESNVELLLVPWKRYPACIVCRRVKNCAVFLRTFFSLFDFWAKINLKKGNSLTPFLVWKKDYIKIILTEINQTL